MKADKLIPNYFKLFYFDKNIKHVIWIAYIDPVDEQVYIKYRPGLGGSWISHKAAVLHWTQYSNANWEKEPVFESELFINVL